eukprot:scaffold58516_cov12-Prasinocladus_malaysianus.AAC.1
MEGHVSVELPVSRAPVLDSSARVTTTRSAAASSAATAPALITSCHAPQENDRRVWIRVSKLWGIE